ncbi:MAG: DNA-binding protein [Dehalococcoidia bacterium]|nr:DNA-binding protein [Dehalococcoidia bacterium]
MKTRLLSEAEGRRTFVAVLERDDEVVPLLTGFAREEGLAASTVSAIGAFSEATLGYFDTEAKRYRNIPVRDQAEVLSLLGDITLEKDEPKLHLHVVLGRRDGSTVGGHLLSATVRPTLEVVREEAPAHLRRRHDPETGLALIDLAEDAVRS